MENSTKKKGGRPATGAVFYEGGQWKVRITTRDGQRPTLPLDPRFGPDDGDKAAEQGADFARQVRESGWTPESVETPVTYATTETVSEWFERWHVSREKRLAGETWRKEASHFTKWIKPEIGYLTVRSVSRRDVERVVARLDKAIEDGATRAKNAQNVWGTLSKMFADANRSKVAAIRVRDDDPTRDVQGPDRGVERSSPYLFPSEVTKLLACETIPMRRRKMYALSLYTGLRPGELAALTYSDIRMDAGYVHVHRTITHDGLVKPTKTKDTRRVPIELALRPLFEGLAGDDDEPVVVMPHRSELAGLLRSDLATADIKREELTADDETRRPVTYYDLRHTYATHRAIRGDDALKIQRGLGHANLTMTQKYINEADAFGADERGTCFAPLPLAILPGVLPDSEASAAKFSSVPRGIRTTARSAICR